MKRIDKLLIVVLIFFGLVLPIVAVVNNQQSDKVIKITARAEENGGWSQKEIHLKLNKDNEIVLISEDVLHSFYVSAFNISVDLYPGHPVTIHIVPTHTGTFHFKCHVYCSPLHSMMVGKIVVE